jgi:heavy metal sensor kinase
MRKTLIEYFPIRLRLILWYVFFLAVIILGFSLYLQFELQNSLFTQVDAGLQVAASQLLVDVDDTVDPPALRPMSQATAETVNQSRFALRMVTLTGEVTAEVGNFPEIPITPIEGFQTITYDGIHWRTYTQRVVTNAGEFDVLLQMAQSLNIVDNAQSSLIRLMLIGIPIVLFIAGLVGMFIADRSLRPLSIMTSTAQQVNAAELTQRIDYEGPSDELGRLAGTLNSMLDRLESAFEYERRFTADASHELRTPLTAIKGQIGVTLSRVRTPEEYQVTLMHIQHETDRLIRLTNDLLFLARLDTSLPSRQDEPLNLSDLLEAVVDQMRLVADEKGLQIVSTLPERIELVGIPDHLIRLFLNLIDNAIKFTPMNGTVTISSQHSDHDVQISIADTGQGIAPEHLTRIFQRFYRAESDRSTRGGGIGLGLAIAYQIAKEHQGRIEVESRLGEGSTFRVFLPLGEPLPA